MALPPCHVSCQFYVEDGELSCQMYQRSGDVGLGVPFNMASYSLLTHMLAHVCSLKPGELVHVIAVAHIYKNHVEPLKEQVGYPLNIPFYHSLLVQLKRRPRPFPKVRFVGEINSIDDFTADKIVLEGYDPHPAIKMDMAV